MLAFEIALAKAEAKHGFVPAEAASAIGEKLAGFEPDIAGLREGTARDGVVVPELVRQLRVAVGEPHAKHLHFGATSQDVIDTALMLRLTPAFDRCSTNASPASWTVSTISRRASAPGK